MNIKFSGILTVEAALAAVQKNGCALQYVPEAAITEPVALAAVQENGYALQCVLSPDLFVKIAARLNIEVDVGSAKDVA
ncbi:MAG: DUF4116 domain-containing protein [Methylacidiphilales bacterium]|nr:DUF4116 domain-containing protein [Candidatus Methylacidiphilales bacterium]